MTELSQQLHRLQITARSPGDAVVVSFDAGGMRVSLGGNGVEGHTEKSFAKEIRQAANGALRGREEAVRRVIAERLGESTESVSLPAPSPDISGHAMSPHGVVQVTTNGKEIDVDICRGTLGRMSDGRLLTEINTTISRAMSDYDRYVTRQTTRQASEMEPQ